MKQYIKGIQHVGISVPDIEMARRFYIDLLGAEEFSSMEWSPGVAAIDAVVGLKDSAAKQFVARLGNICVEVFEYTSPRAAPQDPNEGVNRFGYTHFCMQVEDIKAVYDRMLEAGIRFHTAPDMSGITVAEDGSKSGYAATYGRDFFGNVFELIEMHENDHMPSI